VKVLLPVKTQRSACIVIGVFIGSAAPFDCHAANHSSPSDHLSRLFGGEA
jgi:hypothetical protein